MCSLECLLVSVVQKFKKRPHNYAYPVGLVVSRLVGYFGSFDEVRDKRGISSAGRAPALQAGGRRFDPVILHHFGWPLVRMTASYVQVPEGL